MKSKKSKLILLIATLVVAFSLVAVVLFNINRNKPIALPNILPLNNIQMIFVSNTLDNMNTAMSIGNISDRLGKNINDFNSIRSALNNIQKDSASYSKFASVPIYISTYTDGAWMIILESNNTPSVSSNVNTGRSEGYFYITPRNSSFKIGADINNNLLSASEKRQITDILLSHDEHSDIYIIEKLKTKDAAWVCHDVYFFDDLQVVSFYNNYAVTTKMLKDNASLFIQSFRNCNATYRIANENNLSTTWLTSQYIAAEELPPIVEEETPPAKEKKPEPAEEKKTEPKTPTPEEPAPPVIADAIFAAPSDIVTGPFAVNSHRDAGGILIQTSDNTLYYLDSKGTQKWKVNLDSKIIGEITEVDWYQNKKIQYMFNTATRLYIVDVLGNFVKKFPLSLPVKAQNQIAVQKTSDNDFAIYYNGIDNAFYYLKFNNNDLTIQKKNEGIGHVSQPYTILYEKNTPYVIVQKDDNTMQIYKSNGTLQANVDNKVKNNPASPVYNNSINSKGAFMTGSEDGTLVYINKNGSITTTSLLSKARPAVMYFDDNSAQGKDFFYISSKKIEGMTAMKKQLFSTDLDVNNITNTSITDYNGQVVFVIFSSSEHIANVVRYYKNGKVIKNSYTTSSMPTANDKDVFMADGKYVVKK
ncbi:MAG: hypothetical protein IKT02_00205 [Bacteroidales bacterium]|nr:hypothetical protein [Bacteroidales bacterium]